MKELEEKFIGIGEVKGFYLNNWIKTNMLIFTRYLIKMKILKKLNVGMKYLKEDTLKN